MKKFYSAASHDGVFYRIDLDSWNVEKVDAFLPGETPPNLLMGSFIWNGDGSNM